MSDFPSTLTIHNGEQQSLILPEKEHVLPSGIFLESNSSLELVSLVEEEGSIEQHITLEEGAQVHLTTITVAQGKQTHNLIAYLKGRNAVCHIDWIFVGTENDHYSLSSRTIFDAPRGSGNTTIRGIAQGHAHIRCEGWIEITEEGSGTNAFLSEEALMLDSTAKVDAVPALEIRTSDVQASHSATVSRINPEDLFYFASRGIAEQEARSMCIEGFVQELAERIQDEKSRNRVLEALRNKYTGSL